MSSDHAHTCSRATVMIIKAGARRGQRVSGAYRRRRATSTAGTAGNRPRDRSRATAETIWVESVLGTRGLAGKDRLQAPPCAEKRVVLVAFVHFGYIMSSYEFQRSSCRVCRSGVSETRRLGVGIHDTITMSCLSVACRAVSVRMGDAPCMDRAHRCNLSSGTNLSR